MTRKIANNPDPGDATHVGTNDIDYINKYLTGIDQSGTDPVVIATTTSFNTAKLRMQDSAAGGFYYILNSSAIAANRNVTLPLLTGDDTLVTAAFTQTLTNKTLTAPVISTITNTGTITLPTATDTLVARTTTDTLTNKTLTTPIISTVSNTGTLTLPTSTDTLVGKATTDIMTNKTLTDPKITNASTGAVTATLGTNAPAGVATTPYTWLKMISSDGSTVYVPAFK